MEKSGLENGFVGCRLAWPGLDCGKGSSHTIVAHVVAIRLAEAVQSHVEDGSLSAEGDGAGRQADCPGRVVNAQLAVGGEDEQRLLDVFWAAGGDSGALSDAPVAAVRSCSHIGRLQSAISMGVPFLLHSKSSILFPPPPQSR